MGRLFQSHYRPREGAGPGRKEGELLGDGNSRFGSDKSAAPVLVSLMGGRGSWWLCKSILAGGTHTGVTQG